MHERPGALSVPILFVFRKTRCITFTAAKGALSGASPGSDNAARASENYEEAGTMIRFLHSAWAPCITTVYVVISWCCTGIADCCMGVCNVHVECPLVYFSYCVFLSML